MRGKNNDLWRVSFGFFLGVSSLGLGTCVVRFIISLVYVLMEVIDRLRPQM